MTKKSAVHSLLKLNYINPNLTYYVASNFNAKCAVYGFQLAHFVVKVYLTLAQLISKELK